MKIKLSSLLFLTTLFVMSCGDNVKKENKIKIATPKTETPKATTPKIKKQEPVKNTIDPMLDKGVGPVKSVTIGTLDQTLADKGHAIFKTNCTACHKIGKRYIGPALKGITKRQSPEWIMNMILNPEVMIVKNATAKALLAEYNAPMANQQLTQDEARAVYEYFRTKN